MASKRTTPLRGCRTTRRHGRIESLDPDGCWILVFLADIRTSRQQMFEAFLDFLDFLGDWQERKACTFQALLDPKGFVVECWATLGGVLDSWQDRTTRKPAPADSLAECLNSQHAGDSVPVLECCSLE